MSYFCSLNTDNINRCLLYTSFEKNEPPYTAAEISEEHQIPIRLTNQVLYQLQEIELIHEVAVSYTHLEQPVNLPHHLIRYHRTPLTDS